MTALAAAASNPYAALIFATLFWSGNFIAGRALADAIDPISLNFWRWLLALIPLVPLSWRPLVQHGPAIRAHWRRIALLGLTGVALFHTLVYLALAKTLAVNALLILSLTPIMIAIAAWLFQGERPSGRGSVGIAVSLAGAMVLVAHGEIAALRRFEIDAGALWMLAALAVFAAYSLLLRGGAPGVPPLALHTASSIAGVLWMAPAYAVQLAYGDPLALTWTGMLAIGYIALFASAIAFLLWIRSVGEIGPTRAGTFIHLMPVFGVVLAALLLGERIAPFHVAGATLVFGGLAIANRGRR